MTITGQVKRIHPIESVGANGFQKRKIWVETEQSSDYPQLIEVECSGKRVGVADSLKEGDFVDLEVNLNGRQWNDKVFNTISVWKVTVKSSQSAPVVTAPAPSSTDSDLPF
jgi:hypothetical protein